MYGIEGLLAGRTLMDRYLIREVIGRGGMGAVYRAHDQLLGREVAVKVVTLSAPGPDAHHRLMARFHREARAAARLHHPNVVAVYDFGRDVDLGLDFLVMELLRGEDLSSHVARVGPLTVAGAVEVLRQAARGLAAGHRAGLIHRDVKPGNLFMEPGDEREELRVKVLDFGIAEIAAADDVTVTHLTVAGRSPYSPAFAAPEQMRGDSPLTPAVDVFSLGAVGYHLLTGRRAFTATDHREMVVEVSRAAAGLREEVAGLPAEVHDVLRRALAPHTDDRYPDAGALASALDGVASSSRGEGRSLTGRRDRRAASSSRPLLHAESPTAFGAHAQAAPANAAPPSMQGFGRGPGPLEEMRTTAVDRAPRPGPVSRFLRAAGSFVLTASALTTFAGAWSLVVTGVVEGDLVRLYAGAAASVVATPLALHRVLRRRGSLRFALFGSVIGSSAVVLLLANAESVEAVLATMFVVQTLLASGAELLTRRRRAAVEVDAG